VTPILPDRTERTERSLVALVKIAREIGHAEAILTRQHESQFEADRTIEDLRAVFDRIREAMGLDQA
jgi:hypothetical protein